GADSTSILGVSLKISAYDKVSGIKDISYSNDNKTFTFWEFYAESKEWDLTTFGGNKTNGEKFVYVRVRDIADNIGYGSASILLIMPDILAKDLSFSANPTIVNTAITIQATIFNNGSAHAKNLVAGFYAGNEFLGEIQVGVYTIAELAPQSSYTLTLLWTPQYVGEIKVWVVADLDDKFAEADEENNKMSNSLFVDIGVLPEVYYITINDGALSTHLETVKLKVIAENATLMAFSNDNITWSSWLGYKEECMWKLSPGDGEKTVYFKAKSSKGESRVIKASIILDTKPPKSISLIINDGALYTNKEIVKLGIKAENATLMAFSNDNITWSLWIEYFEEYTWTLTQGDGKKTVYFKTRSGKGESETIKASIVLDTQPPNSVVLSLPNYIKTTEFYVSWSGNDALSSIANYTVQYSNDRLNWFDWLLNVNFTSARWYNTSMNETVYFRCRAIDIVGNIEEYPIGEDTYTTLVKEIPEKKLEKPLALSAPLLALLIGIPLIVALIAVVGIAATRRMMRKGIERISTVMPHILPLKRPEIKLVEAYTFDSFVVAESNKFPYEAAMEVAKNPGKAYNPLFIYGPIGCGKTHLVNSIGNYIKKEKPEFRIQYLTVDEFAARLSEPVDTDVNMLLMDDVQFLARREDVQEKFFYAFNTLYQNGAQIVLTSDRPPKDIEHLQERLRSRFEGGIMAQIKTPELEVRVKVLRREAKKKNTELPDEVVHYIALPVTSIRDLIGSFNKVALYASTNNRPITYELAREALGEYAKFVKEEVPVETVKELPSIDVLLSKVKPKIVEEVVEVERPPSEIPHPPEPELKEERVEVKDEGVYEKIISDKLSSCKSILNELKKKGVEVTDAERMLKLGVSFIRIKKYEKAMGYMEKAEEIAKAKLKLQEDNITAFKDLEEVYECGGCDGLITPGTVGLKCMCGRRYHENCAGRLNVCVECGRRWNV
ncbi:MAG: DnaA/Hda family protein, partial [Candidatus Thermoplasmatota archaeon]